MKATSATEVPKRDRAKSCAKLIQAGIDVFSKLGYHGATTKQIAQSAKVNESLIARYFNGKDGLFWAIVSQLVQDRRGRELAYPAQETVEKELEMYFKLRFKKDKEHRHIFRILVSQAVIDQKFAARLRTEIPFSPHPQLSERLVRLQQEGQLRKDADLVRIHKMIESQILGTFLFSYILLGESAAELEQSVHASAVFWAEALKPENAKAHITLGGGL